MFLCLALVHLDRLNCKNQSCGRHSGTSGCAHKPHHPLYSGLHKTTGVLDFRLLKALRHL